MKKLLPLQARYLDESLENSWMQWTANPFQWSFILLVEPYVSILWLKLHGCLMILISKLYKLSSTNHLKLYEI